MNKTRFYNIFLGLALILLGTTPLSAEVSNIPYSNPDKRLNNWPEIPSLLQPSNLQKITNRQQADGTRLNSLESLDSKHVKNGLCDYLGKYTLAQAQTAMTANTGETSTSGKPKEERPSLEELAKKMDNPLSDLWIIFNQNDTAVYRGTPATGTEIVNVLTIQPILPIPLTKNWNLVNRPIIPIISAPQFDIPGRPGLGANPGLIPSGPRFKSILENLHFPTDRKLALGDINFWTMLSPAKPTKGIIWGIGPSFMFPTATRNQFGTEKYSIGPSNIIMTIKGKWTLGVFHQHLFSIGGKSDREGVKLSQVQPIIWYSLPKLWSVGMAPMMTANWKASSDDVFTIPLGIEVHKTTLLGGKLPVRFGAGVHYSVVKPDNYGQRWNFRLYFVPVIPNLMKGKPLFGR
jgi:hypothetical protein